MADATAEDAAAQRAAEQARLRKERREAKIKAGGSARLNRITGLGGGIQRDVPSTPPQAASPAPSESTPPSKPPAADAHDDPDEVDISEHFYAPRTTPRATMPPPDPNSISEAQLRQMMLGFERPAGTPPSTNPFAPGAGGDDDPLAKMLAQMMGPGNAFPGMPQGQAAAEQPPPDPYNYVWLTLHALLAIGLGLYIVILTPFAGTRIERERAAVAESRVEGISAAQDKQTFLWIFATVEAMLLTTRLFLQRGQQPTGVLWNVAGVFAEPTRGYVGVLLKYGQILAAARRDILVCVFVLGLFSWLRAT